MKCLQVGILIILFLFLSINLSLVFAQDNPVVERVADAGVINFNGKYYLAGVNTRGGFYVSSDLVNWEGPVHVFSMNNEWTNGRSAEDHQIHAADIHYWNGKFHFYWSVNHWGFKDMVVHIGHAVSDNILGPFTESVKKSWFDDRIDAELFIDDDSTFYFYTVKFTDGNTIWGQPMSDPGNLKGSPALLLNSLPGTWERFDNNVIEGPWVIKYREKYYMMYNANHTSNRWGNYALGVAESDNPLGFNSGNKYTQPVVQSNLSDDPDEFRYYFTSSYENFDNWSYTLDKPSDDWMKPGFIDSEWKTGKKGFGSQEVRGSSVIKRQTEWNSEDIWVRKKFTLTPDHTENLQLLVFHSGPTEVYIDGELVYSQSGANYSTISLNKGIIQKLRAGNNLISFHSKRSRMSAHVDVDLVDPILKQGDDILYNPGQPNIVRGPNGFEWWLVYFGIKNGGSRGQFVNRVIFNDRELTVDGPTGSKTPGYHPNPSMPLFGDLFDYADSKDLNNRWTANSGTWVIENNELKQIDSVNKAQFIINSQRASNYLFKSGVKNNSYRKGKAGLVGYFENPSNFLEIGFNQVEGIWYSRLISYGKEELYKNILSKDFDFNVYHSITVLKNDNQFEILIDDNPAPGDNIVHTSFSGAGIPGLFTDNCIAAFDGVIYTPGWDEFDGSIRGWSHSQKGDKMTGEWIVSENGISQPEKKGVFSAFKGDLSKEYEFGIQVYPGFNRSERPDQGIYGTYPVYIDKENYLQAGLDFRNGNLILSGVRKNKPLINSIIPLKRKLCKYPDPKYGDGHMKVYPLKQNSEVSAIEIVKSIYNRTEFSINTFDSLKIFYKNNGSWYPLDFRIVSRDNKAVNRIEFNTITADAFKLVSSANDSAVRVYRIYVTEEKTTDYNLRTVKLNDRVVVFLDGRQVAEVKGSWPESQVGLFCKDMSVTYNGITFFEK